MSSYLAGGCADASAKQFEGIDWNKVRQIEIHIRQDEYSPMVVTMTQGRAYTMSIKNDDDDNHNFRATEFFQSVAMAKASIGDEVFENGCMDAVSLEPGQTAELRFIAVRDGRYSFEDNSLLLSLSSLGGASGSIAIQPKRVVYTPPVRVPDKKPPAAPAPIKTLGNEPAPPGGGLFGPPPTTEPAPPGGGLFGPPPTEKSPPPTSEESSPKPPSAAIESGPLQPSVANSAKPNNDIFGEPIEVEPPGPDKNRPVTPQEPNDDIFAAPLEQSMV